MKKCLMLLFLSLLMVIGVYANTDEVKSVMEGESVTLHTDDVKQTDDLILWSYEPENTFIARFTGKTNRSKLSDDERFRGRVRLDNKTGDLTITNITTQHTGDYKLEINRNNEFSNKKFSVTVYARLPVPDISRYSPHCSSSLSSFSNCVLLCSVMNVRDVSLSWYKGNSLLSIISVSNLKTTASLHLEVDYQENNTYRCVLNNTNTNQTQHLNINEVCQTCSDSLKLRPMRNGFIFVVIIYSIFAGFYIHKSKESLMTPTQEHLMSKQMELVQMGEEKYVQCNTF
ncbi:SLAM family member 5-like [Misgurnus anguillicaudatus]|uniref:SLAM family member 5-like n=1 Tax=Misgurnus anguillicaudatus TaxID=75329 RepID=UPI003CCFA31B